MNFSFKHTREILRVVLTVLIVLTALNVVYSADAQIASAKGIMSFGMSQDKQSFFYREVSLRERFNSGPLQESDYSLDLLAATAAGKTFDGKEIDLRTSLNTTQTAEPENTNIGQSLRTTAEVSKQAPSALYNPETADGFEYGTQAEAAAGAANAADATTIMSGDSANLTASAAVSGWRRVFVSWYGPGFYGNHMANGEILRTDSMIFAHKTLPFGTKIEMRYNGKTAVGIVKDRGPFIPGREFDLGPGIAKALGFSGVHYVYYRIVE